MSPDRDMPSTAGVGTVRDHRPLTARSVVASNLLGVDPPRLPAAALVRCGELFGLRPGATRTALSRMAAAGEVVAENGYYALAGPLLERHARQQEARRPSTTAWDGTWELALIRPGPRPPAERTRFRAAARQRKLAEVREGCWARPANLDPDRAPAATEVVAAQCSTLHGARPDDVAPFLAAFDPDGWATQARRLLAEMAATVHLLDERRDDALGATFLVSAATLRHLVADPLLPEQLQPDGWPATELRRRYDDYETGFKETWRAWYRAFRAGDRVPD